jgi:hypothetical protein
MYELEKFAVQLQYPGRLINGMSRKITNINIWRRADDLDKAKELGAVVVFCWLSPLVTGQCLDCILRITMSSTVIHRFIEMMNHGPSRRSVLF